MTKLTYSKKHPKIFKYEYKDTYLWGFRFTYYDQLGKRHEKQKRGYKSEREANNDLLKYQLDVGNNNTDIVINSEITMKDWANRWYEAYHKGWRPNTQVSMNAIINQHIIPKIGHFKLNQLNRVTYKTNFLDQLTEYKPTTIESYHKKVMALMNAAVKNDLLDRNRLSGFQFRGKEKRIPFSKEDLEIFNKQLLRTTFDNRAFFYILELTGMRKGELLALTWEDINFNDQIISITKSRGDYGTGKPKTKSSIRKISFSDQLNDLLTEYKIFQQKKSKRMKTEFSDKKLVITNYNDNPFTPGGSSLRLKTILKAAGIDNDNYVIHSFRHTHASFLLDSVVNPSNIAKKAWS